MNRRTFVISAVAVALGCVALVIFMFLQDAEPLAQTPNPDTAVLACAAQASAQGSGGCALAPAGKGCGGCPAMALIAQGVPAGNPTCAGKQACVANPACVGNPACAPNPACCPDGCPSIKDGKCPHAGACICPGGAKGCPGMIGASAAGIKCQGNCQGKCQHTCTANCTACPAMKAGTCPGAKGGTCAGRAVQTTCAGMKSGGRTLASGAQFAGCPAQQGGACKPASCQASCPFSSK